MATALIVPSLVVILGLIVGPIFYAFFLSLHEMNLLIPGRTFIGLGNYEHMLTDSAFWQSLGRTFYFAAVSIFLQITLGLGIALCLNEQFPLRGLLRGVVILPWAIPTVINAILWQWIYNPNYGAANALLMQLGILKQPVLWLSKPFLALNSIIVADTWRMIPVYIVMFLAALQSIPPDLYEAAKVDGANALQRFWKVTLPFLRSIMLVILVMRTMQVLRVFDIIYIMTKGGPSDGTMVISFLTYNQTFKFLNFGYGSALAFAVAFITLCLSLIYIRVLRQED